MARDESDLITNLRNLLQPHLERSEPLRHIARQIGELLLDVAKNTPDEQAARVPRHQLSTTDTSDGHRDHREATERIRHMEADASDNAPSQVAEPKPATHRIPLILGDAIKDVPVNRPEANDEETPIVAHGDAPEQQAHSWTPREVEPDLALIERRCRLKAVGCDLAIRRRALDDHEDPSGLREVIRQIDEAIAEAKAMPDCFLWMLWRERRQPDVTLLQAIARCYLAVADAAEVMQMLLALEAAAPEQYVNEAMQALAEASSMLRLCLNDTWLTGPDHDQAQSHLWLCSESSTRSVFIPRFMKLDDPADPDEAPDLIRHLEALRCKVKRHTDRINQTDQCFQRIRYHIKQLGGNSDDDLHHYRIIAAAIESLCSLGLPTSHPRFRRAIRRPIVDSFPDELVQSTAVREVLKYITNRNDDDSGAIGQSPPAETGWSAQVAAVRRMLSGTSIVIVGGEPRPEAIDRISTAFDLHDLAWVPLTVHGSGEPMRAPIARPRTALVLVLVKLAGHLHVNQAKQLAQQSGIPCVLMPAGYNPEQIAHAVLEQASEQLAH